ncbi:MAG: hypothetical protein GEU79_11550 [Acidimicrobiia bacterium]|nr:hypothetical protein [Acidimicrobiia bacterium]
MMHGHALDYELYAIRMLSQPSVRQSNNRQGVFGIGHRQGNSSGVGSARHRTPPDPPAMEVVHIGEYDELGVIKRTERLQALGDGERAWFLIDRESHIVNHYTP